MTNNKELTKTRIRLMLVVSMFVLSPLLAWMFYAGIIGDGYRVGEGKNYGKLIHPARPLENIQLMTPEGKAVARSEFESFWSMLLIAGDNCAEGCSKNIHNMNQIHLALAQDAYRAQRIILSTDAAPLSAIMQENPGAKLFIITDQSVGMLSKFPGYAERGLKPVSGRIYIVDPQGNLMMEYPESADPSKILKDLRQLLKASWIRPRT